MTTNSTSRATIVPLKEDPYTRISTLGDAGFAWEFLRRNPIFCALSWRAVRKKRGVKAKDVCQQFGLRTLKPYEEWCFEGEPPTFLPPVIFKYRYKSAKQHEIQNRVVQLGPEQVAIVLNLNWNVGNELKLVEPVVDEIQRQWFAKQHLPTKVRKRSPDSELDDTAELILMLRALDMREKNPEAKYEDVGELVGLRPSTQTSYKGRGRYILERACAFRDGEYRYFAVRSMRAQVTARN